MIISNYDYQSRVSLEEAILGSLLIDSDKIETKNMLFKHGIDTKSYFCTEFHQDLFERILKCIEAKMKIDLITIGHFKQPKYKSNNSDFDFECIRLTQKISSSAHIEYHLMILKQYILQDYWNSKASDILENSWRNRDVIQVSDNITNGYEILYKKFTENMDKPDDSKSKKEDLLDKWDKVRKGEPISVPTGIHSVDEFSGGWFNGELYIYAGRPGMGKTSVVLLMSQHACYNLDLKGLFFTLEMPKTQLQNRIIAEKLDIDKDKIRKFDLDQKTMLAVADEYEWFEKESKLVVIDECRTLSSIKDRVEKERPKFIVVDYMQLVSIDGTVDRKIGNREQEISAISRGLKNIAMEYKIPVIALSQLSRTVDSRQNKRPYLSDLRESGSIEQDADMVVFFFRSAYYLEKDNIAVEEHEKGNLEYIIAKGRETGTRDFNISIDFKINHIYQYFIDNINKEEFYENRTNRLNQQSSQSSLPPSPLPPPPPT